MACGSRISDANKFVDIRERLAIGSVSRYEWRMEEQMAEETSSGFDVMRVVINLGGLVLAGGLIALIVAAVLS